MKKIVIGLFLSFLVATSAVRAQNLVSGFGDITFWIGSGANQAALIVDFHDGETRQSFAWGYRWDGTASGADMFIAVDAADSNLSRMSFGNGASGFFLTEINYAEEGVTHSQTGGSFTNFPADYNSWGYYLAGGTALGGAISGGGLSLPGTWTVSPSGASLDSFGSPGRILANNSWDAWSFGANNASFQHQIPPSNTVFSAVPEPHVVSLLGLCLGFYFLKRRRDTARA